MARLNFHFLRADTADAALLARCDRAQAECYARFGVARAVQPPERSAAIHYLLVRDGTALIAGLRLHRRGPAQPLPFERFFAGSALLRAELAWREPAGVAEVAGLWSAAASSGTGIGAITVGAALAAAPRLGLRHLCSFAHQWNRFAARLGFRRDLRFGEHAYPDARYRSALSFCDTATVAAARSAGPLLEGEVA